MLGLLFPTLERKLFEGRCLCCSSIPSPWDAACALTLYLRIQYICMKGGVEHNSCPSLCLTSHLAKQSPSPVESVSPPVLSSLFLPLPKL